MIDEAEQIVYLMYNERRSENIVQNQTERRTEAGSAENTHTHTHYLEDTNQPRDL